MCIEILRKNIYIADLPGLGGTTQKGTRPVVVVSNDTGNTNERCGIVTIVPFTSNTKHDYLPTHIPIRPSEFNGLRECSATCEQLITIPKENLLNRVGVLSNLEMLQIEQGIRHALFVL